MDSEKQLDVGLAEQERLLFAEMLIPSLINWYRKMLSEKKITDLEILKTGATMVKNMIEAERTIEGSIPLITRMSSYHALTTMKAADMFDLTEQQGKIEIIESSIKVYETYVERLKERMKKIGKEISDKVQNNLFEGKK